MSINIPKIIHYCWFGQNKMSDIQLQCIATWKKFMPTYELKLWNETNTDMNHPFVKFAYEHKKWAFVSDYVRLKAIYDYGGIYLDTDMFLIQELDFCLEHQCFFGSEDKKLVSAGIIGAVKNHFFINECIKNYEFKVVEGWQLRLAIPRIITREIEKLSTESLVFADILNIKGIIIYPPEYFYPMPYVIDNAFDKNFLKYAKPNTVAIHLWDGSWVEYSEFQLIRRGNYKLGLKKMIKIIIKNKKVSFSYYKKILSCFIYSIKPD